MEAGLCATGSTGIGILASLEDETTIRNGTVTGTGNTCISVGTLVVDTVISENNGAILATAAQILNLGHNVRGTDTVCP